MLNLPIIPPDFVAPDYPCYLQEMALKYQGEVTAAPDRPWVYLEQEHRSEYVTRGRFGLVCLCCGQSMPTWAGYRLSGRGYVGLDCCGGAHEPKGEPTCAS